MALPSRDRTVLPLCDLGGIHVHTCPNMPAGRSAFLPLGSLAPPSDGEQERRGASEAVFPGVRVAVLYCAATCPLV